MNALGSGVQQWRLDNGVQVVVQRTTAAPLVALYIWMEAGSVDERANEHGAAHLLEHMLFKGTAKRGVGVATATIEGLGGDLNAFTSHDETVVHATVVSSGFAETLDVVVDMVTRPLIDPDEFEREKQVVLEEIRSYLDDPESLVEDAIAEAIHPDHPYGRPILGSLESVSAMGPDDLRGFFSRNYGPERCVVAIAGDIDPLQARDWVAEALAGWQQPAEPREDLSDGKPVRGHSGRVLERRFETRTAEIGWRAPDITHPDVAALDVLAAALGTGAASLLTTSVQLGAEAATAPWASLSARRSGGCLSIGLLPREDRTLDAMRIALKTAYDVANHGIPGSLVDRARNNILADDLFMHETVDGLAHDLAWNLVRLGDPLAGEEHRRRVAAVTAADVRRVARTWLRPDNCAAVVVDRDVKPKQLQALMQGSKGAVARARKPSGVVKHVLDNGATILVLPDDTPVVAARVAGLGGRLAQDVRRAGIATAWSRMLSQGAGGLDAAEFGEELDRLSGTLSGAAGRSSVGARASFPVEHAAEGLELLGLALTEPDFDPEEWARLRDELTEEVHTLVDRPVQMGRETLWDALYRGHPWRLPTYGSEASLEHIGPGSLRHWHERLHTGPNLVLAIAGGVEPDAVIEGCAEWLGGFSDRQPDLPVRPPVRPVQAGTRFRQAGREQTTVVLGARGVELSHPDRLSLEVAAALLGGQSGRLFMALREKLGLAYSVWAHSSNGWDGGMFRLGLATDPKRTAEARDALRRELDRAVSEPATNDEVSRYKRMLVGHTAMGLQRAGGRAADAALGERYGLPFGLDGYRQAMQDVTAESVNQAMAAQHAREWIEVVVEPLP